MQGQMPAALRPATPETLDIDLSTCEHLLLRRTLLVDRMTTTGAGAALGLDPRIVTLAFEALRSKKYVDVLGLDGNDYRFELTDLGRARALDSTARCSYSGTAPVSLRTYETLVNAFADEVHVTAADVQRVMSDLVLVPEILDAVGPAFSQQRSVFLYGPPGTGKTSIAERMTKLYGDVIVIPYAIEVDGQIITVFDPTLHKPVQRQPSGIDPRWVVCERPFVITGGELELSMLQLRRDPTSGVYNAPLQMKANNGVLLIDDFGRQLVPPGALLNRWIVPLERRIDFLSLDHGTKFAIPFEVLVVFSTNFPPRELGDQAFFRRIPNKIYVGDVSPTDFDAITSRAIPGCQLTADDDVIDAIRLVCFAYIGSELRGCYPWDIAKIGRNILRYEGKQPHLTRNVVERAAKMYFAMDDPREGLRSSSGDLMGRSGASGMWGDGRSGPHGMSVMGGMGGMGAGSPTSMAGSVAMDVERELRAMTGSSA
jgi:hypothetical protein